MRHHRLLVAVLVAVSCCGVRSAYAAETERDALITQAVELSGLKDQLGQFPAVMQAQLAAREHELSPEVYANIKPIFTDLSQPALALQSITQSFEAQYDHDKFAQIIQQLQLPLWMKMTALATASSGATQQDVQAFIAELQKTPSPEPRVALMRRLNQATDTAHMLERISLAVTKGFANGMAAAMDKTPPAPEEIETAVHEQAIANAEMIESAALLRNLFTYRTATDVELQEYVSFAETALGCWFTAVGTNALIQAYADMTTRMGTKLADIAKSMPRTPKPAAAEPLSSSASP